LQNIPNKRRKKIVKKLKNLRKNIGGAAQKPQNSPSTADRPIIKDNTIGPDPPKCITEPS
tara:strand:- start:586 stop:765 length:180 start_codon:yes stop_codon:yes gene_type:complete